MTPIASLDRVTKRYAETTALADVSLGLIPGETIALIGHNGAGKTTLMKLILGLIRPTAGRILVLGEDPAGRRGAAARRHIGFLPESVAFHATMSGRELLDFYARLKGVSKAPNRDILARVGLADAAGRRVGTYSKGMRQRLALAQALIGAPRLLLLDEPTTGLDPASRLDFYMTVDELRRDGATVLVSTHALAEIEQHVERIAVMHRGRLLICGTAAEICDRVALPLRLRVRMRPCTTGRVLEALEGQVRLEERTETSLLLACEPVAKMPVLQGLARLSDCVEDIEMESAGLEAVYRNLVLGEERR